MNLKLIHILNSLDGEREKKSIGSLSKLKNYLDYIQQVTPLYKGEKWKLPTASGLVHKGAAHYGLYESYKKAIKENFSDDLDALIICECDSVLDISHETFLSEMKKTLDFCNKHEIFQFSWGGITVDGVKQGKTHLKIDEKYPNFYIVDKIIETHFIILTKQSRDFYLNKIEKIRWDTADIWLNHLIYSEFTETGKQGNVFNSLASQCDGQSLLDANKIRTKIMNKNDIKYPEHNMFSETYNEVIEEKIYEKFFEVQKNDIIVDIGSNIGLFTLSTEFKYSKCYVIEPSPSNFKCLKENLQLGIDKTIFINEAISNRNTISNMSDTGGSGIIKTDGIVNSILNRTYSNFIKNYKIEKIDFLKIDCEGGEYFVFSKENVNLLKNIKSITGEFHIVSTNNNINFTFGPDNTLIKKENVLETLDVLDNLFDVIYTSVDGIIIHNIRDRLDYYNQFLFYAINKVVKNKIVVEYLDGYIKIESLKFDNNTQLVNFIDTENNTNIYSSKITNISQWSKTTKKVKECKVVVGNYEVTVNEKNSKKFIIF
jgi:FkbM family methyltransferase